MKTLLCAFACALGGVPAFACPTVEDLRNGIEFRTADGGKEIHRQTRPDWIVITTTFADGNGTILEAYQGLYLLSLIPIEAGVPNLRQREDYANSAELEQWQAPEPNKAWENPTPSGGQALAGPLETVLIDACRYDKFTVELTYNDDDTYRETYDYLPDLGIGLLTKTEASDGIDTYSYVSLRRLGE
ncbi:MAG: hypothetical protein AAF755_01420 [Pseudomonadota bacterium]